MACQLFNYSLNEIIEHLGVKIASRVELLLVPESVEVGEVYLSLKHMRVHVWPSVAFKNLRVFASAA